MPPLPVRRFPPARLAPRDVPALRAPRVIRRAVPADALEHPLGPLGPVVPAALVPPVDSPAVVVAVAVSTRRLLPATRRRRRVAVVAVVAAADSRRR